MGCRRRRIRRDGALPRRIPGRSGTPRRGDRHRRLGGGRMSGEELLQVSNLVKEFPIRSSGFFTKVVGQVQAVSDVSFDIGRAETLGLVGEAGTGKATAGPAVPRLHLVRAGRMM